MFVRHRDRICINRNAKSTIQVNVFKYASAFSNECKANKLQALLCSAVSLSTNIIQLFRSVSPLLHPKLFGETNESKSKRNVCLSFVLYFCNLHFSFNLFAVANSSYEVLQGVCVLFEIILLSLWIAGKIQTKAMKFQKNN